MGAVAALISASHNYFLNGLILDSPFSNLKKMAIERTSEKTMIP